MHGGSIRCVDLGIARVIPTNTSYEERKLSIGRQSLQQRFYYLLLRDLAEASEHGFIMEGKLFIPLLLTVIADQKRERIFFF